ncbi:MAG: RNA polymerase sigma-70 factor [Draconibacterium sp.]
MGDSGNSNRFILRIDGEKIAFESMFKAYFPRLKRYCIGMVQDNDVADDLVQDSFLKLWEKRYDVHNESSFKALLYTIVRNNALNYLKRNKLHTEFLEAFRYNSYSQELFIRSFLDEKEQKEEEAFFNAELKRLLGTLPEKCREAFLLSRFEGLSNKEVAKAMEVSVKTVEKHLAKARSILRKSLLNSGVTFVLIVWMLGI